MPKHELFAHAKAQTLRALHLGGHSPAHERLAAIYNLDGDFAGAAFTRLEPNDRDRFTPADIAAVSLASVTVEPGAVRRMLTPGVHRDALNQALTALPQKALGGVTRADLVRMIDLYSQVKSVLSRASVANPDLWVLASKLCSSKRPRLFPLRDPDVCTYLGTMSAASVAVDWLVFRDLINDPEVLERLGTLARVVPETAGEQNIHFDGATLRMLGVALWTAARAGL